jgi:hypothetical protein
LAADGVDVLTELTRAAHVRHLILGGTLSDLDLEHLTYAAREALL